MDNSSALHLCALGDGIKVDAFVSRFRHCNGCQEDRVGNLCMRMATGRRQRTNSSSSSSRGHQQIPGGDLPTELPTKLEEGERRNKPKENNSNNLPNLQRTNCGTPGVKEPPRMLLSCLKITQLVGGVMKHKGFRRSLEPASKLVGHLYLRGNPYRDAAPHSERREAQTR